ncbi:hypothetical protein Q9L58_010988, partial [Maublancomyces gigas]
MVAGNGATALDGVSVGLEALSASSQHAYAQLQALSVQIDGEEEANVRNWNELFEQMEALKREASGLLVDRDRVIAAELHRRDHEQRETNEQIAGALNLQSLQTQQLASRHEETREVIEEFLKTTLKQQIQEAVDKTLDRERAPSRIPTPRMPRPYYPIGGGPSSRHPLFADQAGGSGMGPPPRPPAATAAGAPGDPDGSDDDMDGDSDEEAELSRRLAEVRRRREEERRRREARREEKKPALGPSPPPPPPPSEGDFGRMNRREARIIIEHLHRYEEREAPPPRVVAPSTIKVPSTPPK